MPLFKNIKLKTDVITIRGEDFTLVEPSSFSRTCYFDYHGDLDAQLKDIKTNEKGLPVNSIDNMKFSLVGAKLNAYLIAICLIDSFPELRVEGEDDRKAFMKIHDIILAEIRSDEDMEILTEASSELTFPKVEATQEEKDSPTD